MYELKIENLFSTNNFILYNYDLQGNINIQNLNLQFKNSANVNFDLPNLVVLFKVGNNYSLYSKIFLPLFLKFNNSSTIYLYDRYTDNKTHPVKNNIVSMLKFLISNLDNVIDVIEKYHTNFSVFSQLENYYAYTFPESEDDYKFINILETENNVITYQFIQIIYYNGNSYYLSPVYNQLTDNISFYIPFPSTISLFIAGSTLVNVNTESQNINFIFNITNNVTPLVSEYQNIKINQDYIDKSILGLKNLYLADQNCSVKAFNNGSGENTETDFQVYTNKFVSYNFNSLTEFVLSGDQTYFMTGCNFSQPDGYNSCLIYFSSLDHQTQTKTMNIDLHQNYTVERLFIFTDKYNIITPVDDTGSCPSDNINYLNYCISTNFHLAVITNEIENLKYVYYLNYDKNGNSSSGVFTPNVTNSIPLSYPFLQLISYSEIEQKYNLFQLCSFKLDNKVYNINLSTNSTNFPPTLNFFPNNEKRNLYILYNINEFVNNQSYTNIKLGTNCNYILIYENAILLLLKPNIKIINQSRKNLKLYIAESDGSRYISHSTVILNPGQEIANTFTYRYLQIIYKDMENNSNIYGMFRICDLINIKNIGATIVLNYEQSRYLTPVSLSQNYNQIKIASFNISDYITNNCINPIGSSGDTICVNESALISNYLNPQNYFWLGIILAIVFMLVLIFLILICVYFYIKDYLKE